MQDTKEIWKPIPNYEGLYEASNFSIVRSVKRTVIDYNSDFSRTLKSVTLNPTLSKKGYYYVTLCKGGVRRKFLLHRIISQCYIQNPLSHDCVNHIDGNKKNNSIINLEWCSYSENNKHAYMKGLRIPYERFGEKNPKSVLNNSTVLQLRLMRLNGDTYSGIAKKLGISKSAVAKVIRGETWGHVR